MRFKCSFIILILLLALTTTKSVLAQHQTAERRNNQLTRILFVFDASRSMYGEWDDEPKIDIARRLLTEMLDSLRGRKNMQLGLRVYGHQHHFPPQHCDDTKLEIPFEYDNIDQIVHKLKSIAPKGTTPIARSLEEAADDFTDCENCRNIVILITDGIEECGGDPCDVSLKLQEKGVILKPFVIGIGKDFKDAFDCVGTYFDTKNEEEFRTALNVAIDRALNPTTAQINLLDINGNPTETNVNMSFYNKTSGELKYNLIHTLNAKGNPDTLKLDPMITYKIDIHTIPPLTIDSFGLTAGKHNKIGVDAPQGYLKLVFDGKSTKSHYINCIVRKDGKMKTLNVQNIGKKEKYLIGKYDLEVLTLPRLNIEDVAVNHNHTTTIDIPSPGMVVIQMGTSGYGSVYKYQDDGSLKWIYNLPEKQQRESLFLLPGDYKVVFRSRATHRSRHTRQVDFEVKSGKAQTISIYKN
ncbi:MAG: VWA domain-containing protein [Bacteroidales bacterium]|nr:VWA domain-containing protein [Bacteroidales bacterium]MCF8328567.1 VWA domain-containing protein [Bacteroidales bacterium]